MSEEYVAERSASGMFVAIVGVGLLAALVALGWCYALQSHLTATEQKLAVADQKNAALVEKVEGLNARLRATSETLGQSVGITQKQMEARTQSLIAAQAAAEGRGREARGGPGGDEQADWRRVERCGQRKDRRRRRENGCCRDKERPGDDEDPAEPGNGRCRCDERSDCDEPRRA